MHLLLIKKAIKITIVNLSRIIVLEEELTSNKPGNRFNINVGNLTEGMYFLTFDNKQKGNLKVKFIKE
ncbi:MAG: T9SS type A sorting domain-containing protein [Flavobacteriales bacterium]|nr:T9SS type A sorting domain-containing protein [Flavobacteriales bacterium]